MLFNTRMGEHLERNAFLSVAIVAMTLRVTRQRVHQLITEGKLLGHQWGGIHWVVMAADLEEYIGAGELERSQAIRGEWLELRRAILAQGGIGPSTDWPRDWYPGDLYRAKGKAPDLVAAETHPWSERWGNGDDSAMFNYLQRAYAEHRSSR